MSDWSYSHELSSNQIHYAALDAWASLEIYDTVKNTNEELISTPTVGQYLSLWSPMGVAAYGIVETSSGFLSNGIVQVSIIHIARASFVLPSIDGHQTEITLEAIKNGLPKTVSVHKSLLRNDNKRHAELEIVKTTTLSNVTNNADMDITGEGHETEHEENNVSVSALDFARTLFGDDIEDIDKANFEYGYGQFKNRLTASITESTEKRLYTRVVKDVFHLMDSIKIGSKHSLKLEFAKISETACLY
ncbi:hypothetical protein INT47_011668 [Mucor saturninus]|uniref:Uncharacterized protein n=1 Tax=Mucor saturninus TaxID=64648 RepID=A0A8H7QJT4_9FUNG|nr:hypothetical protein INT47_011668 [Mucor saturninus]